MEFSNLEEVIRYHIPLSNHPNSNGFYSVLCKVCNDHGRKGLRAGFKFGSNGEIGYHCFNCGHKAKYDPSTQEHFSKNLITVLNAFSVPEADYKSLKIKNFNKELPKKDVENQEEKPSDLVPPFINFPQHFYKLGSKNDDIWSDIAYEYLKQRDFNPNDYPFYLSTNEKWLGRLIIPIYRNRRPIYFQGRKMDDSIEGPKYKAPWVARDCVFFNYDEIYGYKTSPLYIVEGFFDAFIVNGIALLGNDFTPKQIEILNKCPRQKIYIPDRTGNGYIAAQQAINTGWSISLPELGDHKDLSEATKVYGKIYVLKKIVESITSGEFGAMRLGLYCNDKKRGYK